MIYLFQDLTPFVFNLSFNLLIQGHCCAEKFVVFNLTLFLFRLGEPFEEETSDGRKCTTTVTMEGNKLITDQKAIKQGEKDVRAVSFLLPSEFVFFIGLKICITFLDIIISIYKIQNLQNILI